MTGPSISHHLGLHKFEFYDVVTLRDAMLASFADAEYACGPYIIVNRECAEPAWLWVLELLETRTDWWECAGVAMQHACDAGGEQARTAAADLLGRYYFGPALLPWAEAIAARWPDSRAPSGREHFVRGDREPRLADIVEAHKRWMDETSGDDRGVVLFSIGGRRKPERHPLHDQRELEALLRRTAQTGPFDPAESAWSWLTNEVLHRRWLADAIAPAVEAVVSDAVGATALVGWLAGVWDLWRLAPLLERWRTASPPWWNKPLRASLTRWRHPPRSGPRHTLGDAMLQALAEARDQLATPPILNLAPFRPMKGEQKVWQVS